MSYTHTPVRQRATTYQLPDDADKCRKVTYAPGMEGALNRTELLFASSTDALTVAQLKAVAGADLYDGAVRPVKNGAGNPMGRYVFRLGLSTPTQTGVDTLAIQNTAATGWWLHEDLGARVVKTRKRVAIDLNTAHLGNGFSHRPGLTTTLLGTPFRDGIEFTPPATNNLYRQQLACELSLPTGVLRGVHFVATMRINSITFTGADTLGGAHLIDVLESADYATGAGVDINVSPPMPGGPDHFDTIVGSVGGPYWASGTSWSGVWSWSLGGVGANLTGGSAANQLLVSTQTHSMFANPVSFLTAPSSPEVAVSAARKYALRYVPWWVDHSGAVETSLTHVLHQINAIVDVTEVVL